MLVFARHAAVILRRHQTSKTKGKLLDVDLDYSDKTIDAELDVLFDELRSQRLDDKAEVGGNGVVSDRRV